MHELSACTIRTDGGAIVNGYVREFVGDVLMVRAEHIVRGFEAGQDVTIEVLDEVRGECLYAGFVTRVGAGGVDIADTELVSTLQKREVARVRISLPFTGTLHPRPRGVLPQVRLDTSDLPADDAETQPETESEPETESGSGTGTTRIASADPSAPDGSSGPVRFVVLDISAHGMRMHSQQTIPLGVVVRFRFDGTREPFVIDALVVRSQESRTGTHYGCRFTGMTPRETDELFRYVMKTQGEQRRERLRG